MKLASISAMTIISNDIQPPEKNSKNHVSEWTRQKKLNIRNNQEQ